MKTISDEQQRLIDDAIGELSLALSPAILEKDILVTEALRAISQVNLPGLALTFCGGTLTLSFPESLTAAHDLSSFSCGKPVLDHWLKTRALSNQQKGFTAVIVVHDHNRVVGYYGLAPTAVVPAVLP